MPSNTVLVSGPAVGAAQILSWSFSCVLLPPVSTAVRASAFSRVALSVAFYIFHTHRVCLVDCVDLIASLFTAGGEVLDPLPQPHRPWVSAVVLSPPLHVVVHWHQLLRLPWRAWACPCEGRVWRWCSCFGRRASGRTRSSGELAARVVGNTVP